MNIETRELKHVSVVTVSGRVDSATAPDLQKALQASARLRSQSDRPRLEGRRLYEQRGVARARVHAKGGQEERRCAAARAALRAGQAKCLNWPVWPRSSTFTQMWLRPWAPSSDGAVRKG